MNYFEQQMAIVYNWPMSMKIGAGFCVLLFFFLLFSLPGPRDQLEKFRVFTLVAWSDFTENLRRYPVLTLAVYGWTFICGGAVGITFTSSLSVGDKAVVIAVGIILALAPLVLFANKVSKVSD